MGEPDVGALKVSRLGLPCLAGLRPGFTWSYELIKHKPQEGGARKWWSKPQAKANSSLCADLAVLLSLDGRPLFFLGPWPGSSEAHSCADQKQLEK